MRKGSQSVLKGVRFVLKGVRCVLKGVQFVLKCLLCEWVKFCFCAERFVVLKVWLSRFGFVLKGLL